MQTILAILIGILSIIGIFVYIITFNHIAEKYGFGCGEEYKIICPFFIPFAFSIGLLVIYVIGKIILTSLGFQ